MTAWSVPSLPTRLAEAGHPRLVGRRQELERLDNLWELVEKGERQAVFLGGEPGSGKSRLVLEIARALHAQDNVVLLGFNSPGPSYPYEPLIDALNQLLTGTEAGSLRPLIPDNATELLRVTPHLRRHRPDLESPPPGRNEYRRELFEAFVDLLRAVAAERPVAVFLEDMHWSSAPTRLLMSHLIESTPDSRILLAATMRTTEPDRSEELSYLFADLYRLPGVSRFDLSGLGLEDIESFLIGQLGESTPHLRESAALLRDQTGGNPFFLREIWRDVALGSGALAVRRHQIALPHSVRDSLERRIGSFDPATRTVLEYAAVLGPTFDATDLVEAIGRPRDETLAALDLAVAAGLVLVAPGAGYSFQHALIRQALVEGLTPSKSAETHARLAESIADRRGSEPDMAPLLARLYEGAGALGYRGELISFLTLSAESASRGLAHEEAAELWERAARLVAGATSQREGLLLSAARAHLLSGDFPEARRVYTELNSSSDPDLALRAAIGFEEASWRPGALGHDARALLEGSVDRIEADPTNPLYVGALVSLARANTFSGDIETAGRLGERALAMARALGDDNLVADALVASVLRGFSLPHTAEDFSELSVELRSIVMRTGDFDRLGPAGANKASNAYVRGDARAFRDGWSDIRLAADKTGQPFWQWVDGCYRHCSEFMTGDFEAAAETAIAINDLGYTFGADDAEGPFGLQMYMVKRETGALEEVRPLITGDPGTDGTWSPGLLSLYTELEMQDSVRTLLANSLALPETTSNRTAIYPAVIAFLTEAALYLEDVSAVKSLLPYMSRYDGSNLIVGQCVAVLGSGDTYLGRMHGALGDQDRADRHFRRAIQMDLAIGSLVHQATTLAHYAGFLGGIGEPERASEYRNRARQLAEPMGHRRVLRLLDRLTGDSRLPDGLTVRELEVLRLVVEGASNKQIGDRLHISTNTAANHVRNILVKTDSPNRTAAATYATARGLI